MTYYSCWLLTALLLLAGCKNESVSPDGLTKDQFFLENKGATMPVFVEGNLAGDKLLILVHGGPGDGALYHNTEEATTIAESKFAVVYWDQRVAGSSQGTNVDSALKNYSDDLKKLIQLLHYRYGESKKIYLLGHSWGGFLIPLFLEEGTNQRLISGWIQVDGSHNYPLNDSLSRSALIAFGQSEITANKNTQAWQTIVTYCQRHDPAGNYTVAREINSHAHTAEGLIGAITKGRPIPERVSFFVREYNYPLTSFLSNGVYANFIKQIDRQAYVEDVGSHLPAITLPILLLWGQYDFVCPVGLRDDIVDRVSSRDVTSIVFSHSGHSPMLNEPVAFWNAVSDWVMSH